MSLHKIELVKYLICTKLNDKIKHITMLKNDFLFFNETKVEKCHAFHHCTLLL